MDDPQRARLGSIRATQTPEVTVVHLSGEIDAALTGEARAALAIALRRHMPVELDASGVTFMDARGLAFLMECSVAGRSEGLEVSFCPAPPAPVTCLMSLVGEDLLHAASRGPGAGSRRTIASDGR